MGAGRGGAHSDFPGKLNAAIFVVFCLFIVSCLLSSLFRAERAEEVGLAIITLKYSSNTLGDCRFFARLFVHACAFACGCGCAFRKKNTGFRTGARHVYGRAQSSVLHAEGAPEEQLQGDGGARQAHEAGRETSACQGAHY